MLWLRIAPALCGFPAQTNAMPHCIRRMMDNNKLPVLVIVPPDIRSMPNRQRAISVRRTHQSRQTDKSHLYARVN
jgi:hypothetical protein